MGWDEVADVDGIVLVPSVVTDLGLSTQPPAVDYTARGLAALWAEPGASPVGLAALVGGRRAELLQALDVPASTTGLAARCGLPVSSTSEHLGVHRASGLAATHRTGRSLAHTRTPLGSALLSAGR